MRFLDWFIADSVRQDGENHQKARQLLLFVFLLPLLFIPNILKWSKLGCDDMVVSLVAVTVFVSLVVPILFRITGSVALMGNAALLAMAWHFFYLTYWTGGIASTAMAWNLVLPVFAITFVGFGSAAIWMGVILIEAVGFIMTGALGVSLPKLSLTPDQYRDVLISNSLGPFLALSLVVYFNHRNLKAHEDANAASFAEQEHALKAQEETQKNVKEMTQNMSHVFTQVETSTEKLAESTEEIASMTKSNANAAAEVDKLMGASQAIMEKANNSMKALTGSIGEISESSEQISKIIKNIDEIAFQTNLLALNAAVEAARAGEAGAGFAVVADEVRNLAIRAAESAKETERMIGDTVTKIQQSTSHVSTTNEAFANMSDTVGKAATLLNEIASGSQEQARGVDLIRTSLGNLYNLIQQRMAATGVEAVKMVEGAIEFCKEHGAETAIRELRNENGRFNKGELYVFAYSIQGIALALTSNPALEGKSVLDIPDATGKYFRREIIRLAKTEGTGWVDYSHKNPKTGKVDLKTTYLQRYGDIIFCCGIYKSRVASLKGPQD